jgi:hypothetical protein
MVSVQVTDDGSAEADPNDSPGQGSEQGKHEEPANDDESPGNSDYDIPDIDDDDFYVPDVDEFPFDIGDDLASKESTAFADDVDLEKSARENDHYRVEDLRDVFNNAMKGLFVVAVVITEVAVIFWSWHLLLPREFWFLEQAQLDKVQSLLVAICLSGLVGGYAKRVVPSK